MSTTNTTPRLSDRHRDELHRSGISDATIAENGVYNPRVVRLGVGNFDYTEVVSGLKEGEQVALLAAAAMQARREEQNNRIRSMGGMPGMPNARPGGGGGAGGGGRGQAGGGGQARP